jgi:hypothetical protein
MVLEEAMVLDKELNFGKNLNLLAVHNSGKLVKNNCGIDYCNKPSIQELF